jgi:hypothetical protein
MIREATVYRLFILLVASTTASAAAFADDHTRLHGTYAFTTTNSCIVTSASTGFDANFTPNAPASFSNVTDEGVRVFRADGTGTLNGRAVSVGAPPFAGASSSDYTFQYTYTIGEDGKLSITIVPGTYKATVLTGPRAGQTEVIDIPVETGFIGEDRRTIVLGQDAPVVSRILISTGEQFVRVCNRSRTMTRISGDDR